MIDALGPQGAQHAEHMRKMLANLDTNDDGAVSRDEFVAGAPEGVSAETAGTLFDSFDSEGEGSLGLADLAGAFRQIAPELQSALIAIQSEDAPPPRPHPHEAFASLDADGDGTLTREEFIAGRPDNATEEQAGALYESLSGGSADGLTETQFADAMKQLGPPPGPPPADTTPEDLASMLDGDGDGTLNEEERLTGRTLLNELLKAVAAYEAPAGSAPPANTLSA